MNYKNLFSPIKIAGQTIKNRIAMAPMGSARESQYAEGKVSTELIDFFEARAKGGTGVIISPFTAVDKRYYTLTLGLFSREHVLGISRLAEALKVFGSKFILQLSHFGGKSPKGFEYDNDPIAPSSIESIIYPIKPIEMSKSQIEETRDLFIQCALWARDAGCDGIELHAAHGYLINQFISPYTNRRNDRYGGSLENRMRFATEIADTVRKECGNNFIIGIKMSAHEHLKKGIDTEEAIKIAKFIDKQGLLDYVHVSAFTTLIPGFLDCDYPSVPPIYTPHPLIPLAEAIKKEIKLPVIATGGINDPAYADYLISDNKADMVALGRALIADPEWANKAMCGGNIKYCILCNTCYFRGMQQKTIKCSVNPYVSEETRYKYYLDNKTSNPKKILIIGAGPGGLEAALTAHKRGHQIKLIEKENKIGGLLRTASIPSFKGSISSLLKYYEREILDNNIDVEFRSEVKSSNILEYDFDAIIIAIGGKPVLPEIKGIEKNIVVDSSYGLKNQDLFKESGLIVIGAGLVGLETALHFAMIGKKVSIVDIISFEDILRDEHPVNRSMLIRLLRENNVEIFNEAKITEIADDGLIIKLPGKIEKYLPAQCIINATGHIPKSGIVENIIKKIESSRPNTEIYTIGDCVNCKKIYDAVNAGANIAWRL